jgi:hypothetical protein
MPRIVPSRIALARRGSLSALAILLAVLASARLLRRYGRLNFIEFFWEKVAFAELAAGAGVRRHTEISLNGAFGVPQSAAALLHLTIRVFFPWLFSV